MEDVFSRHVATDRMVSGAYKTEYEADQELQACMERVEVSMLVGEILQAMEDILSRHVATDRMVSEAYKTEYGADQEFQACMERVELSTLVDKVSQAMEDVLELFSGKKA